MKGRVVATDADIDAALARAKASDVDRQPVATAAKYIPGLDLFVVDLSDGDRLLLDRKKLQGLENASRKQLANVTVEMLGTGLHWPDLNVDHHVPGLIKNVFGTKRWMSELGRAGGQTRSDAKTLAARANGSKGGRPKRIA